MGERVRWVAAIAAVAMLAACGSKLPPGTTQFRVGRTVVRTDSILDVAGVVFNLADTSKVPPQGPFRHWLRALAPELGDSAFGLARAIGPAPVGPILETYAAPQLPDSACGLIAPGTRRCFTGNDAMKRTIRGFLGGASAFVPRAAPAALDGLNAEARRQDLSDVYVALTRSRALDSAVAAYSGYPDLRFDVTLARTFPTWNSSPSMDPAEPRAGERRIFLAPDPVNPVRSYRSSGYVWLALGHQMAHAVVRRLLAERPQLLGGAGAARLHGATEGEMARSGYPALFWDEVLAEQLARAITVRVLSATSPTVTWAARSEAFNTNMTLVPWLEDALAVYEKDRARYPTLSDFAGELKDALDRVPLDGCRAASRPGVALIGVAKSRAVVGWLAEDSPFRRAGLAVGDTVVAVGEDGVSAAGLLVPTRQLTLFWSNRLPFELGLLGVRRRGHDFQVGPPMAWTPREAVRVPSQARSAVAARGGELPICRWVTRALRR